MATGIELLVSFSRNRGCTGMHLAANAKRECVSFSVESKSASIDFAYYVDLVGLH